MNGKKWGKGGKNYVPEGHMGAQDPYLGICGKFDLYGGTHRSGLDIDFFPWEAWDPGGVWVPGQALSGTFGTPIRVGKKKPVGYVQALMIQGQNVDRFRGSGSEPPGDLGDGCIGIHLGN